MAVILNALRALRPPAPDVRMTAVHMALTRRFRIEHQAIRTDIEELRAAADTLEAPDAMTRVHRVYDKLIDEIGTGTPDDTDIADLRSLLYGLYAILRLHTVQEDETYLSLVDDADARPDGRARSHVP